LHGRRRRDKGGGSPHLIPIIFPFLNNALEDGGSGSAVHHGGASDPIGKGVVAFTTDIFPPSKRVTWPMRLQRAGISNIV
ncbi:MAG TPA: hypothetical protein PLV96_08975, partial [Methanoregulaceae archaeon]|nr:hypothetical protein [Methanoregulaceae archaeon]